MAVSPGTYVQPDLEYIKNHISVITVARDLGLHVIGCKARCWRGDSHKNGDADPSIGFHKKTNRWRCFVCDPGSCSNIDLVMSFLDMSLREALEWFCATYYVPQIPRGRHSSTQSRWKPRFRVGVTGFALMETLVQSGLWAALTPPERAILPVLLNFSSPETGITEISYKGIMRYSGVRSSATVAKALNRFENMHCLKTIRGSEGVLRRCNRYRLTVEDPKFQEAVIEIYRQQRLEIEVEKDMRAQQRLRRKATCIGKNSLHPV